MSTLEVEVEPPDTIKPERARVALRTFSRIAELWKLSATEQMRLLGLTPETYHHHFRLASERQLSRDLLERISYILGIFKNLQILLPPDAADQWVRKPNRAPLFNGSSALDRMLSGNVSDLYEVRKYLDSQTSR